MTAVYDMVSGHLIGVETERTADVFATFLKRLPPEKAEKIESVAMDMGPVYQKADSVFDR